jgi:hypothetical protein
VSAFIASGAIVEIDERPAAVNCVRNWLARTGYLRDDPQRWHDDVDGVEAVKQISLNVPCLIVRRSRLVAAITRTLTMRPLPSAPTFCNLRLEESQKQALHPQRHLADFVEKIVPMGSLELSWLITIGAGEAAFT